VLHREQQVAGRDPGAAHGDRAFRRDAREACRKRSTQLRCGQEAAAGVQAGRERVIAGSRHVAGDGVDRLDLTAIAFGRTDVEDARGRVARPGEYGRRIHGEIGTRARDEAPRSVGANVVLERQVELLPAAQPAVEHGDVVVAEPAQHPPEARGVHRVAVVVGNHR
jgi:hypothetical protein